jgi:hypothetical protein
MANLPKNPALIKLDAVAAPLYHAMGQTLTRWQFTEAGMFLLAHAIIWAQITNTRPLPSFGLRGQI